jgi:hypothetical protein
LTIKIILSLYSCIYDLLIVFGLTRSGFKPTIYHTRGEHANHYITDVAHHQWTVIYMSAVVNNSKSFFEFLIFIYISRVCLFLPFSLSKEFCLKFHFCSISTIHLTFVVFWDCDSFQYYKYLVVNKIQKTKAIFKLLVYE